MGMQQQLIVFFKILNHGQITKVFLIFTNILIVTLIEYLLNFRHFFTQCLYSYLECI